MRVWEPEVNKENPNEKPKYKATVLIPKSDAQTLAKIQTAINNAKAAGKSRFGGVIPPDQVLKLPLHDADLDPEKVKKYPEMAGHYYINAKSDRMPGIVNDKVEPILNQDEVYSGIYGRVGLTFFAWKNDKGGKGISAALDNLQKLEDGEALGASRPSAESDFGQAFNSLM